MEIFRALVWVMVFAVVSLAAPPKVELLWTSGAPGAQGNADEDKPSLTIYLPDQAKATGGGIVVCPGGGYQNLAMDHAKAAR
jgi:hypothetical protein